MVASSHWTIARCLGCSVRWASFPMEDESEAIDEVLEGQSYSQASAEQVHLLENVQADVLANVLAESRTKQERKRSGH